MKDDLLFPDTHSLYHSRMRCPVCKDPLIVVERDSIEVDYCIRCHGLWFDEGEIELLGKMAGVMIDSASLEKELPSASGEKYLRCPRCTAKMRKVDLYRGDRPLIVDFCPKEHGFWFDEGEIGGLISESGPTSSTATGLITKFLGETFDVSNRNSREEA
ncbi:MAG: zf-TFIIB domain-containing protein [Thermoanaerobaculia bacterium]|nr:zf-TFIIB domain-containing protein [Thermoanaerobaculia bacterium]